MGMYVRSSSREDEGLREISYICILITDADFRVEALQQAIAQYGDPWILSTDQGGRFVSTVWIDELNAKDIKISMDGKDRRMNDFCRVAEALIAIRMRVPERLRKHESCKRKTHYLDRLLQVYCMMSHPSMWLKS